MSNPLKRARVDSNDAQTSNDGCDATAVTAQRHPSLWLKDGSIVLKTQATLFKVHQTTLALHSTVFADMFGIPQPDDQDMIEGCPVVDMADNENDLTRLLRAIYEPS